MSHRMEVFVRIPGREESIRSVQKLGKSIQLVSGVGNSVSETSSAEFNRLAANSNSEWIAFVDSQINVAPVPLERALEFLDGRSDLAAGVIPLSGSIVEINEWARYPARLASLIRAPQRQNLLLIRTTAFNRFGRFADVSDPIWDWVIRTIRDDGVVAAVDVDVRSNGASTDGIPVPALVPGTPKSEQHWLLSHMESTKVEELVQPMVSPPDAIALKAGLLQMHDDLDASHKLSQSIGGCGRQHAGDYWHGIMHRREPDYSNAKYWFRRVGRHPVFEELAARAEPILDAAEAAKPSCWKSRLCGSSGWDPIAFVDLCAECGQLRDRTLTEAAEVIQFLEMQLLLEQTYVDAGT